MIHLKILASNYSWLTPTTTAAFTRTTTFSVSKVDSDDDDDDATKSLTLKDLFIKTAFFHFDYITIIVTVLLSFSK